jgi:Tfp pilus assembly protein PilF
MSLQQAVRIAPDLVEAHGMLAVVLNSLDRHDDSIQEFEAARQSKRPANSVLETS